MNYSLTCVKQSRCDTHLYFYCSIAYQNFLISVFLLMMGEVCHPRSNPEKMLNFLKYPEGR